jgi:hypothetical protein
LAQRIKLFLAEINLSLFHVCQFDRPIDIRQGGGTQRSHSV